MVADGELRRDWRIVLAAAVGLGCGASAIPYYSFGAFVLPVAADLHVGRDVIQLGVSILAGGTAILAPVVGLLIDRYGPRRLALISSVGLGVALAALGIGAHNTLSYCALWALVALLSAGSTQVTYTRVISGRFAQSRGLALGLCLVGTGIAAGIVPLLANWLVGHAGWRWAYVWLGAISISLSLPILYVFLKDASPGCELDPAQSLEGADDDDDAPTALRDALRSYRFWVIAFAIQCAAIATGAVIPNLVPILVEQGRSSEQAAVLAGTLGVTIIAARIGVGILLDRFWPPAVAFLFISSGAAGCLLLAKGAETDVAATIAILLIGLTAGAEFDLLAYLIARTFGLAHYGKIYAVQFTLFAAGVAIAPLIVAAILRNSGTYDPALQALAGLLLLGGLSALSLGQLEPGPKRARPTILSL